MNTENPHGMSTGLPALNDYTNGIQPRSLVVVGAHSGNPAVSSALAGEGREEMVKTLARGARESNERAVSLAPSPTPPNRPSAWFARYIGKTAGLESSS